MNNCNQYPENDWRNYLEHSAKGQRWPDHKYIDIINGVYVYTKDQLDRVRKRAGQAVRGGVDRARKGVNTLRSKQILGTTRAKMAVGNAVKEGAERVGSITKRAIRTVRNAPDVIAQRRRAKKEKAEVKKQYSSLSTLGSKRLRKKTLKQARKELKAMTKEYRKKNDNSLKARVMRRLLNAVKTTGGKVRRVVRTVKNAPDVIRQRRRASAQRAEARASLPSAKDREKILKNARRDINKKYWEYKKSDPITDALKKTKKNYDDIFNLEASDTSNLRLKNIMNEKPVQDIYDIEFNQGKAIGNRSKNTSSTKRGRSKSSHGGSSRKY